MPAALAMAAPVQWVASCGGSVAVRATTRSMTSWPSGANPRRPGLVAQQAVDPFLGEAFLPAPDAGLGLPRPAHDLDRAEAAGRKQHDLGPPGMLLRGVAVADDRLQAAAIDGAESDGDTGAHAPDLHGQTHRESRRGFKCQI